MRNDLDRIELFRLIILLTVLLFATTAVAGRRRTEIDPNETTKVDPNKPNIVFVFADDLGWADVGYNGARFYETPHIDQLVRDGMVFNRFYPGGPNCAPSRACILTGTYTPRHRIYTPGGLAKGDLSKMRWKVPSKSNKADASYNTLSSATSIPGSWTSIAEVLKPAGYTCARIGKWHIGDDLQGFDLSTTNGVPGHVTGSFYSDIKVARNMTDTALDFIEDHQNKPFFLFLSHWEVHTALKAEQHIVDKYKEKLKTFKETSFNWKPTYAAEIEVVDRSVGRVRQKLQDLGLTENTLFIFSSDNGGLPSSTTNHPLHAGKGSLFEGGIRTACAMVWPKVIQPGSSCDIPITGVDLMPTFAELGGGGLPSNQPGDGDSFVSLFT
ncbi:MAG: sulfatase-like hydrolase/transferase, partial [Bacteroidales bacterium]|nr:sulfatase-like hydrolase/transferase [Bacteroidales bacterium]